MNGRTAKKVRKTARKLNEVLTPEIVAIIREKAQTERVDETYLRETEEEFFNADDASGGNFDDAYEDGQTDGEIGFARFLMSKLENTNGTDSKIS